MKRKLLSILAAIFVFVTCAFVCACEGKYDKMSFAIYYAYTEDADEWYNANNGIVLNYGSNKQGELVFDGVEGKVYLKVKIKNVKSNYVDTITVSAEQSGNLNFSSTKVKQNKVFSISVGGNVSTRLKFYENNSNKSKTINLNVYRSLEGIEVDNSIKPAVMVNSSINLQQVKNLIYLPVNRLNQSLTNQTGVTYSVESIGAYLAQDKDSYFAKYTAAQAQNFVSLENGVLSINNSNFLGADAYIVRVKATSIYHDGSKDVQDVISADFDVFVVEDNQANYQPELSFVNTADESIGAEVQTINLFSGNTQYSSSYVFVDEQNFSSVYKVARNSVNGTVSAKLFVAVLDESTNTYKKIDFENVSSLEPISGLLVTKETLTNGETAYRFYVEDWTNKQNTVKFGYEFVGLDFSASAAPVIEKNVTVEKGLLPSEITVNENVSTIDVYSTASSSYKGVALNIKAVPSDSNSEDILIEDLSNVFTISTSKGILTSNTIKSNSTIFVKFKSGVSVENATLTFKTKKSPSIFNGENESIQFAEKALTVRNRVTADSIEIVKNDGTVQTSDVLLNAANASSMYVKVSYNGNLDASTITLKSNNESIKFKNSLKTITIDQCSKIADREFIVSDNGLILGRYDIYKVEFQPIGNVDEKTSIVSIVAGNENVGVQKSVVVRAVSIMNNTDISVQTTVQNAKIKNFSNADGFKFAVASGTFVEFEVVDGNGYSNTIANISLSTIEQSDTNKFTSLLNPVVIPNNMFSINVSGNRTQVMNLKVAYYMQTGENIEIAEIEKKIEIAAYNPVSSVNLTTNRNKLALLSGYDETSISISSSTSSLSVVSDKIYFTDCIEEGIGNVNQLKVSYNGYDLDVYGLVVKYGGKDLIEGQILDVEQNNSIIVKMTQDNVRNNLKIKVSALYFGQDSGVFDEITIKFAQIDEADRITIYGDNIIHYTEQNSEIQLSFLNVEGTYVEKDANVVLEFDAPESENIRLSTAEQALDYRIFEYQLDENGSPIYENGLPKLNSVSKNLLNIKFVGNTITVGAYKDFGGGLFKLEMFTSYGKTLSIDVRVSDGINTSYIITSVEEFFAINNNLSAKYVLGSDLTINLNGNNYPIGYTISDSNTGITPFTGELNGTLTSTTQTGVRNNRFTLNVFIENTLYSPVYGHVGGLFTILESATVKNLNLNVDFASNFESASNGVSIGAIAGVIDENSTIENVNVNISCNNAIDFTNVTSGTIKFGGVVGVNNGSIKNVSLNCLKELKIKSASKQSLVAGLIAGVNGNNATIVGGYKYENLDSFKYDVVAHVTVTNFNLEGQTNFNVGGIVGNNQGTIQQLLVGGKIESKINNNSTNDNSTTGNLAGIAALTSGTIENCAILSLDLKDGSTMSVAGVAGVANNAKIENVKYISAITKFNLIGERLGQISGVTAAGIVVEANNTTITNASVESFVKTVKVEGISQTFNTITGTTVAGLVVDNVDISQSFVHANIHGTTIYSTVQNDESKTTYFFGKQNDTFKFVAKNVELTETDLSSLENWQDNFSALLALSGWALDENHNIYEANSLNFYFPYLVDEDGNALMIISPTDISAALNQAYITSVQSVYVSEFDISGYEITETALIDYYYGNGHVRVEDNTHKITELVTLTIVPAGASGGLKYEIVGTGYRYAYINGENIVFTAMSAGNPIIVKCYSVFNPDIEEYVAFYTQAVATKLILQTDGLKEVSGQEFNYELDLYGTANKLLQMSAENVKDSNNCESIFATNGIENYLTVEVEGSETYLNKLNVNVENFNSLSLSIKENAEFVDKQEVVLTYKLYLKENYFNQGVPSGKVEIGTVKVKVRLHHSATDIVLNGADYEAPTSDSIVFDVALVTGYVDANSDEVETFGANGNIAKNTASLSRDDIMLQFEIVSGEEQVARLVDLDNLADLFEYSISAKSKELNGQTIGYDYKVILTLKEEFKYITESFKLKVTIMAVSDSLVRNSLFITFKPTKVSTTRISNYNVTNINVHTTYQNLIANENLESSIISPSGLGSIMYIYVEPAFSNIDEIKLSSSSLYVPSLSKNVTLKFTQLVYNMNAGAFETLYGSNDSTQVGDTISLSKISRKDGTKAIYDGIIYVYVQLEHFSGLEATITASLDVTSNGEELPTVKKPLLTTYLPGAEINYSGHKIDQTDNAYLVQSGTVNTAEIKVYGYQFNSNPTVGLGWNLLKHDGSGYHYDLGSKIDADTAINDFANGKTLWYKDDNNFYHQTNTLVDGITAYYDITTRYIYYANENNKFDIRNYVTSYINTNYEDVVYNAVDDSYTMEILFNVARNIPAAFDIGADLSLVTKDGQLITSQNKTVTMHPTDYILNSATLTGLVNGYKNLAIHRSTDLEFYFGTDNKTYNYSAEIYKKLIEQKVTGDNYSKYLELFKFVVDGQLKTFASEDSSTYFSKVIDEENKFDPITLIGAGILNTQVMFSTSYSYQLDQATNTYELKFNTESGIILNLEFSFGLNIFVNEVEDEPEAIESVDQMFNTDGTTKLVEGGHYILMKDIVVENLVPIDVAIGSFDGNNKTIKIKNFVIDKEKTNYGLFASIGTYLDSNSQTKQTILKNVIVDYSEFNENGIVLTNNNITTIKFGGLAAENNGALIYNCDVMNLNRYKQEKVINILVDNNSSANVTFGGLVGENTGIITNSRVGRDSYFQITNSVLGTGSSVQGGPIKFTIGNTKTIEDAANGFNAIAGAFVGKNSGTISSSYVANTGLINYSTSQSSNKTAGFVAENSGNVLYSYVKALEDTITRTNPYSTGTEIESKGNGMVAGFVYSNSGKISNAFANTELKTKSAYIAGFVYNNASNGEISESYAACTMNSGLSGAAADDAEQPFVGLDNSGELLSYGKLENTYYLLKSDNYINQAELNNPDKDKAQGKNANDFEENNNLFGFVFVLSNSKTERDQGIWSYYDTNNQRHILPELTNANLVAISNKYVQKETGAYISSRNYEVGTANNPYIIRNVDEYIKVFGNVGLTGYVRFINNIDFNEDETSIQTRVNYTLGDKNRISTTSIEGNGMTIKGIYLDAKATDKQVGLFANIESSYIKNLNLEFATPKTDGKYSTTSVMYSGGLAGKINNSSIINISLTGSNVTLTGQNFVGGLAGMITGQSLLFNIKSNLSVVSNTTRTNDYLYYNQQDFDPLLGDYENYLTNLSYAGGIAGVLDLTSKTKSADAFNVAYIDVGQRTDEDSRQAITVTAEYSGGIAGYASNKTNALKLKFNVGADDLIKGNKAAGGLFGVFAGDLTASQVTATEDVAYDYDLELGKYIVKLATENAELDLTKIGNINLIESSKYAGGLIGIGLDASVNASYSKASIKNGQVVGGLIGASIASSVTYSYANLFINLNSVNKDLINYGGGLIGAAYGIRPSSPVENADVRYYENYVVAKSDVSSKDTDIQFTFSTLFVEDKEFGINWTNVKLDYVVAKYNTRYLKSNGNEKLQYVYAGTIDYKVVEVENRNSNNNSTANIKKFFKFSTPVELSERLAEFQRVFPWSTQVYWTLDESKFYPLLLNKADIGYEEITSASQLINRLNANPTGSYKLMNDIDLSEIQDNWVIYQTFRGVLVGNISGQNKRPQIRGIKLVPNQDNSTGFFRETSGATISGIEFVWDSITIKDNRSITNVGGISCKDTNSLFSNVQVMVPSKSENGLLKGTQKIASFGGIVATASGTNLNGCEFIGNVTATLYDINEMYFGGIAGRFGNSQEDVTEESGGTVITNCSVGGNVAGNTLPQTAFEITINSASTKSANIGGLVGFADSAVVTNSSVGGITYADQYKQIEIKVTTNETQDEYRNIFNIGGLVGRSNLGSIHSSDATTIIEVESLGKSTINVGGLIGQNKEADIETSNTQTEIVLTNFKDTVNVSTGIALFECNDNEISQCLFNGSINTESAENEIVTLFAGGTVAQLTGKLTITEVMTNADIIVGSNKTTTLFAGGQIGSVELASNTVLNNTATTGRIVPITSNDVESGEVGIGGVVGRIKGSATVENSYSLVSILADSIKGKTISQAKINALFGSYGNNIPSVENLFYSSDYALFPENSGLGTNISANVLAYDTGIWNKALTDTGSWAKVDNQSTYDQLPYIVNIVDALNKYEILIRGKYNAYSSSNFNRISLSQISPTFLKSGDSVELTYKVTINETEKYIPYYVYFIIDPSITSNTVLSSFSGDLNGVLMGQEQTYKLSSSSSFATKAQTGGNTYTGLVAQVNKHSAISNLHVNIDDNTSITVSDYAGIIVGLNNGVISNSSVQGHGIKLSGASFGLITAENNGLLSYVFSTAEILTPASSTAGLTHTNNGGILSSYFTGYIGNNSSSVAAGIAVTSSGYIYNTYMGGVIESITYNSFVAQEKLEGSNNFIDRLANVESGFVKDLLENTSVSIVDSLDLFSNKSVLNGNWNWYVIISYTNETVGESVQTVVNYDKTAHFGYNFGYPVYKFNKMVSNDGITLDKVQDVEYQAYTGTGVKTEDTLSGRYNAINGTDGTQTLDYKNAFKISHLGVLKTISGLMKDADDNDTDLNYVLIYDIDKAVNWEAISFNGLFVSNKNFLRTQTGEKQDEHMCKVAGLNVNGLFKNVHNAYIADLILGSFANLNNSGALGTTVTEGNTTVINVKFELDSNVSGNAGIVAGLFGTNYGNLTFSNIVTGSLDDGAYCTITGATVGLLVGKMDSGKIDVDSNCELFAKFGADSKAGGVVGKMVGGALDGNNVVINIGVQDDTLLSLGAIVGETNTNAITISNFNVNLTTDESYAITTNSFGLIAEVNAETAIYACRYFIPENANKKFTFNGNADQTYGLIAGTSSAEIEVEDFSSNIESLKFTTTSSELGSETNNGVGVLVGKNSGNLSIDVSNLNISLNVINIPNLGGVAGYYEKGEFKIGWKENQNPIITLNGTDNVGGVFGYCDGVVTASGNSATFKNYESGSGNENSKNLLQVHYVTISLKAGTNTKNTFENIGGLFGVLTNDIKDVSNYNKINIQNGNSIVSAILGENKEPNTVINVGGVAGKFIGSKAENVKNANNITSKGVGDISENLSGSNVYLKGMNVGGVFGFVKGAELINLGNTGEIQGYQNVGGLVGYTNGTTIKGEIVIVKSGEDVPEGYSQVDDTNFYIPTNNNSNIKNLTLNVLGTINVGGLVGCANETTIKKVYAEKSDNNSVVAGNVHVGGLVGLSNGEQTTTTIDNNYVTVANVKATYYKYQRLNDNTGSAVVFIPTSIGGVIGSSIGNSGAVVTNNILNSISVTSAEEGIDGATVISTISNPMAKVNVGAGNNISLFTKPNKIALLDNDGENNAVGDVKFNDISTGFGGLIGTTEIKTITNSISENETTKDISSNIVKALDINAQLGVNVGTFYGAIIDNLDDTNFKIPVLNATEVKVDGAYNIGGLVGLVEGSVKNIKNSMLSGNATIKVQGNDLTGMYVGGMFGKVVGAVDNVELLSGQSLNLVVNTANSYFIGGLVGRWETNGQEFNGNVGTLDNAETNSWRNDNQVTVSAITDVNSATNFGGLIGMLKVTNSSSGSITVKGKHAYPFTVNTIENSNYYDGKSYYDSAYENNEIFLIAQAYYINLDTFNIDGTSNKAWYDKSYNNGQEPSNPTRPSETWGWSKEYTGFKQMQRCIPQDNLWDSIAIVYDAYHITNVGTIGNLFPEELETYTNEDGQTFVGKWLRNGRTSGSNHFYVKDHICYTIYEEEDDNPTLYSSIGIATLLYKYEDNGDGSRRRRVYSKPKDDEANFGNWLWGAFIAEEPKEQFYIFANRDDNPDYLRGLTYFDSTDDNYKTIDGKTRKYDNPSNTKSTALIYQVGNYVSDGTTSEYNTKPYFMFSTIYDQYLPYSGSVFEVNGYTSLQREVDHLGSDGTTTFEWIAKISSAVLSVVLFFATAGTSTIVDGIVFGASKAAQFLAKTAKFVVTYAIKAIKLASILLASYMVLQLFQSMNTGSQVSKDAVLTKLNNSFGLLSESYTKQITFRAEGNGMVVNDSIEKMITVEYGSGENIGYDIFNFYSSTRPSDYSTAQYIAIKVPKDDDAITENNEITTLSKAQLNEMTTLDMNSNLPSGYRQGTKDYLNEETHEHKVSNGYIYIIYKNYYYYAGNYYVTSMNSNVIAIRLQKSVSTSILNASTVKNGSTYVYGYYDGSYHIGSDDSDDIRSEYPSNNLTYESGSYKVNGTVISDSLAIAENTIYFEKRHTQYIHTESDIYGYNYITGAYYTANGTGFTDAPKYAKFTKQDSQPSGIENVDWIKIKFYQNKTNKETGKEYKEDEYIYYSFDGDIGKENLDLYSIYSEYNSATYPENIKVAVYVSGFTNPYTINSEKAIKDKYENNKWEYYYSASDNNSGVPHTATYYYYEGGYQYQLLKKIDAAENSETYKNSNDIWFVVGEDRKASTGIYYIAGDGDNATNTLVKYTDMIPASGLDLNLPEGFDGEQVYTIVGDNIKYYFLKHKTTLNSNLNDVKYTSVIIARATTQDGNTTYTYEVYEIADSQTYILKDGLLHQQFLVNRGTYKANENKYFSNKNYKLYTKFKYTENLYYDVKGSATDTNGVVSNTLEGIWPKLEKGFDKKTNNYYAQLVKSKYRLMPDEENLLSEPNGSKTYLVERVQLILSSDSKFFKGKSKFVYDDGTPIGDTIDVGKISIN